MKKLIAFLLVLTMMTVSLAACDLFNIFSRGEKETTTEAPTEASTTTKAAEEETTTKAPVEETTTKKPYIPKPPTPPEEETTTRRSDDSGNSELEFPQLPL